MLVARASSSVIALLWVGSRCETRTNAISGSCGRALSNSVKASRPPADAPTPTTGKVGAFGLGAPVSREARGRTSREGSAGTVESFRRPFFLCLVFIAHPGGREHKVPGRRDCLTGNYRNYSPLQLQPQEARAGFRGSRKRFGLRRS